MAYRNGVYFAFDGLGESNPTKSDFKYYATIQAWNSSESIEFSCVNSHDKVAAVRDTSSLETLKRSIRERLSNSKNILVILSSDTRKSGSLLSYEIEQAADKYKLPFVIAYAGYQTIMNPDGLSSFWPNSLSQRITGNLIKAIHIPFVKSAIFDAIGQFSINAKYPATSKNYYSEEAHRNLGLME